MPKAIVLRQHGGPETLTLEEVPERAPGPGQIRLRHTAVGVNFHDVYVRSGLYRTLALPGTPGIEAVGVIDALGEGVTGLREGQRVTYMAPNYGGYAEQAVIPAEVALPLPDAVDDVTAASLTLKGLTAAMLAGDAFPIQAGHVILIHAGAGGVGQVLTRWARSLGATVIATVGSPEKAEIAKACGADHTILYREEDFVARVREITGGAGVAAAYDSVGKDTFFGSLDCLAKLGRLVNFGQSSGAVPPFEVSRLAAGSFSLVRPMVSHYMADPARRAALAAQLFDKIEAGVAKVDLALSLPLEQAAEAHRALESRALAGSVVLTV